MVPGKRVGWWSKPCSQNRPSAGLRVFSFQVPDQRMSHNLEHALLRAEGRCSRRMGGNMACLINLLLRTVTLLLPPMCHGSKQLLWPRSKLMEQGCTFPFRKNGHVIWRVELCHSITEKELIVGNISPFYHSMFRVYFFEKLDCKSNQSSN